MQPQRAGRVFEQLGVELLPAEPAALVFFGSPGDMKFRSCMTLFSLVVDNPDNPFRHALDRWCGGQLDEQTLALVDAAG